ncbi:hypothetical protein [Chryseobacterium limigenitum]|uniref:Adenomatosis polyposis coli down-regulated 1 n=1 Tax=Chryseobacterium limigenitum TaxID=1612149 RepID=A0A1K2IVI8_9FLAO|nr:hypothetical protein [Chryseobacterium limigenitum]SFZ96449.1 Adenomatosis polyposis coli down-regulated 1 [Chryseobacterium limigenitum]
MDKKGFFVEEIKKEALGAWKSIAVEVRPSSFKNEDGSLKPFYLTREFSFLPEDKFQLEIINYADAYGKIPLVKILIKGEMEWQGDHPVAEGAQKVDFTANESYEVTPLIQNFADVLNNLAKDGFDQWEVGKSQNISKKKFIPFGLKEGDIFKEYDLIYLYKDMMFWGARNVDGRGFDTEENRPTNLQIPMVRK